jgi:amino-acid N-acetyltransferase
MRQESECVPEIRAVTVGDAADVLSLLCAAGLPEAGVLEANVCFFVADLNGAVIGAAGLEIHGRDGLLRSVVVQAGLRDREIGRRLTVQVIAAARAANVRDLYLLTTTAARYFRRYGFVHLDRPSVSPEVQNSHEFREACPATATAMVLHLSSDER